jgi:hypothetical protein
MSFNTSTLANSNYPLMSQTEWDNAPFNQEPNKEREFKVYVCQTLSKDTKVITDDYDLEVDDEEKTFSFLSLGMSILLLVSRLS